MALPTTLNDRADRLELQLYELNGNIEDMIVAGLREFAVTEEQLEKHISYLELKVQLFPLYNAFRYAVKHHPRVQVGSYEVTTGADCHDHYRNIEVYVLQERLPLQFTPWEDGGFPLLDQLPDHVTKAASMWCMCITSQAVLLPALDRAFAAAGTGRTVKMMDLDPRLNVGFMWANREMDHLYIHSVLLITDKDGNHFVFDPTQLQLGWNQEDEWLLPFKNYRAKYIAGRHTIRTETHLREWQERMRSRGEGPDTTFWQGIKSIIYDYAGLNLQKQREAKEQLFKEIEETKFRALSCHKAPEQVEEEEDSKG
ncbi:uncharacterized protein EI97DRAFT_69996 [Westerdykella ornata]|uniref:Uncharacterized protein n=1 Tax=Westerdykella ornata TaxID=318751 RepID=A0A6A6JHN3_WESOR|nr:uncharacterized protein EI97DRAFT_69996 [Westerdykella ornata]KAF2275704.1 hypothetical protein EI97DRAFT_69996 [Westerdykella ornata]